MNWATMGGERYKHTETSGRIANCCEASAHEALVDCSGLLQLISKLCQADKGDEVVILMVFIAFFWSLFFFHVFAVYSI